MENCILKPSQLKCQRCSDIAQSFDEIPNCEQCPYEEEVKVLAFTESFWGSHATVINKKGEIKSVSTEQIKVDLGDIL
jgi:hypothetical protein